MCSSDLKMCIPKKGGMGFSDFHCFNLALLAKQVWRLLCEPDSLCARVLKAKYYPSSDLLNVELKKGASYTWQSIWAGIQTFKKGCIWRVGSGDSINIWDDPWIPPGPSRKLVMPCENIVHTRVSELIDQDSHLWKEELIRERFSSVDANRILSIPLAEIGRAHV